MSPNLFASSVKSAKCSDLMPLNETLTPRYLAIMAGYMRDGKMVNEEVDMGDILKASKKVNEVCRRNKSMNLATIKSDFLKDKTVSAPRSIVNPMKLDCGDFVALENDRQPVALFWVAGHAKTGRLSNGEVDNSFLSRPIETLIDDCKADPKALFYTKATDWLSKNQSKN